MADTPSRAMTILLYASAASLATGASLTAGTHTLGGRNFQVLLPATTSPAPVLIVLHGNGGTGNFANTIKNGNAELAASHIIVGPDGPSNSWNIKGEASNQDDAGYVGSTLLDHLATFSNVVPSFKLLGSSNGAALCNRILIENDDARITHVITLVSQLNTFQYRGGAFYVGGTSNAYTQVKSTLTSRNLLQIVGGSDVLIPADGGTSGIPDGTGGNLVMVGWQDSVYAYAQAFGYGGSKLPLAQDDSTLARVSYLSSQVVGVNLKAQTHGLSPSGTDAKAEIDTFLGLSAGGGGAGSGGSGGSGATACSASCAAEFTRCVNFGTNTYATCRQQIDANHPPLQAAGCVAQCTNTASMAALDPSSGSGGGGDSLSAGALAGIIAGSVTGMGALLMASYVIVRRKRAAGSKASAVA